jgi:putative tryptophan/tyrosine transport system substrate-binding protein
MDRRRFVGSIAGGLLACPLTIRAAKAATAAIPLVFVIGGDPVTFGIVASLNRPGGNVTGLTLLGSKVVAKRLGLLLELIPTATVIGVLANPNNPISESQLKELRAAARASGRKLLVLKASAESDFAVAFATIDQQNIDVVE